MLTLYHQSDHCFPPQIPVAGPLRQHGEPNLGPLEHRLVVDHRSQHKHYLYMHSFYTADPSTHISARHWLQPWATPHDRGVLDWRENVQPKSIGYRAVGTMQQSKHRRSFKDKRVYPASRGGFRDGGTSSYYPMNDDSWLKITKMDIVMGFHNIRRGKKPYYGQQLSRATDAYSRPSSENKGKERGKGACYRLADRAGPM
jgi:hypothetical protein